MSSGLMLVVTALYLGVVFAEIRAGNHSMAIVFAGYSLANVGLTWNLWK